MTLRQVVPWENDEQERLIRRWQGELSWLRSHGYVEFHGTPPSEMTSQQYDFLWALSCIGSSPTDGDLLQRVYGLIQSSPSWLQDLEQFIAAAKEKILVITSDDLARWTDEQLSGAVKAGKILSFVDEGWGVMYEISWDEEAQAFYDRHRRAHFGGIACLLLRWMTSKIELIAR